jgi:hypothetical protein
VLGLGLGFPIYVICMYLLLSIICSALRVCVNGLIEGKVKLLLLLLLLLIRLRATKSLLALLEGTRKEFKIWATIYEYILNIIIPFTQQYETKTWQRRRQEPSCQL